MLTVKDLTANTEMDRAAMKEVAGGFGLFPLLNAPIIDAGSHFLAQSQYLGVDQSFNIGGLNLVINNQEQNGVSGQVA